MRKWKWVALIASGAMLLQTASCATDFAYMVAQGVASRFGAAIVETILGTPTGMTM
jgi:hypothetical protein